MVIAKRARSAEQKVERRQEILAAAAALYQAKPYDAITMDAVAAKAGMAKGTVFLYFPTKEALFFQMTFDAFSAWFDDMERVFSGLATAKRRLAVPEFLSQLGAVQQRHHLLSQLMAISHSVFERNIGYDQALAFKQMTARRLQAVGGLMEQALGFLRPGQGVQLLMWMYAMVIGFVQLAQPAPVIRKVYQRDPEVGKLQIDFGQQYYECLGSILDGWKTQNRGRKSGKRG